MDHELLWKVARSQTTTNEDGKTVICADDDTFDDEW